MVSLLAIAPIIYYRENGPIWLYLAGLICVAGIAWAVWRSKTESKEFREMEAELGGPADASKTLETAGVGH